MGQREVWKVGGTSLDTPEKRRTLARKVAEESSGDLVVVVSAAAGVTDHLIHTISGVGAVPQDIIDAYVATGEWQSAAFVAASLHVAGRAAEVVSPSLLLSCDDRFGDADVIHVDPTLLLDRFDRGVVPVVPGFFGRTSDGRTCLLGRGGSDYTAVLIGNAIGARVVLLKNDTDGIYNADPNQHPDTTRFDRLTHEEALRLALGGAKVLNGKAATLAFRRRVEIEVRSTFGRSGGTRIVTEDLVSVGESA